MKLLKAIGLGARFVFWVLVIFWWSAGVIFVAWITGRGNELNNL